MVDPSKACDCLLHDLLIAKIAAYGFDNTALALIRYLLRYKLKLTNLPQWVNLGQLQKCSARISVRTVGPILFNLFINDFMFFIKKTSLQFC